MIDRLRITNVKSSDEQQGDAYACMAMNGIMRSTVQGKRFFVRPRGSKFPFYQTYIFVLIL